MARFYIISLGLLLCGQPAFADKWLEAQSARLQTLDKITARISTLEVGLDNPVRFGTLEILVHRCAYRPPEESPEDAAFLTVRDVGHDPEALRRKLCSQDGCFHQAQLFQGSNMQFMMSLCLNVIDE